MFLSAQTCAECHRSIFGFRGNTHKGYLVRVHAFIFLTKCASIFSVRNYAVTKTSLGTGDAEKADPHGSEGDNYFILFLSVLILVFREDPRSRFF